ncbi:cation transporter [Salipaludibacillus keqinensis]|uniref:Cation transporter n=1 Tax=Salipaludibacillus keqinensis TaxID=2045207 RepID=A0A323TLQ9_9BACI|nr:sodium:calcium antiporter [Salipaludibacillus keqinensis]PYZ93513.1 cation transporter [Salipaludibacillus keqinensis]
MMYLIFVIAAVVTVLAAIKLSTYADVIAERSSLGGMMVGTLLLAGATSLPEVTTSLTAIVVNNPDIAVSNVLGSNLFNLFILAAMDIYYRRKRIFVHVGLDHIKTGFISFGLTGIVFIAILSPSGYHFMNIGLEMYLLVIFYLVSMKLLLQKPSLEMSEEVAATSEPAYHTRAISLKRAKIGFGLASLIIFIAGSMLTITGDAIAISSGLGSSFVGTFLIAGATSLPEAVTVIVAIQLANYQLAVGNIVGSNLFNLMILALSDLFFRSGPILSVVHPVTLISVSAVLLLNCLVIGVMILSQTERFRSKLYPVPSTVVIAFYLVCSYMIFHLG